MKKVFFLLLSAAIMSYSAIAQKVEMHKVPTAVLTAFKAKFPLVTKVNWEMENQTAYEAEFKLNGEEMSATFDKTGKWLETEKEIKVTVLPQQVQATLKRDFANFKVTEASKIESVKHGDCYEAEIKKGKDEYDLLLTKDGQVISKTKIEDEE
jgi:hypothetical protein